MTNPFGIPGVIEEFDTSDLDDAEFQRLATTDPLWFMQVCEKIVDKQTKKLVPFVLSPEQKSIYDVFWYLWSNGKPVRIIVLKARQLGISTLAQGLGYWMVSTKPHTKGLVLAHEKETTKHIFQMSDRFSTYDKRIERSMMPKVRRSSVTELNFGNPNRNARATDPGLDSDLTIATADNKNAGHGWTGSYFQGSEVARWPKPELLAGVLNALTEAPETFGILESTANGANGVFYETWKGAVDGTNGWIPIFLPWNNRPEYQSILSDAERNKFRPTNYEESLIETFNLTIEQLDWRRRKISGPECQGQGRDPESIFKEQFPLSAEEAFVSTGMTFFDMKVVTAWEERIQRKNRDGWKVVNLGDPQSITGFVTIEKLPGPVKPSKVEFQESNSGDWTIYYPPEDGRDYIVGADVAAGINSSQSDWSVAFVLDRRTLRVCAKFRAKIHPDHFADRLIAIGWYYNEAFVSPEANAVGIECARHVACNYRRTAYYTRLDEMGYGQIDGDRPGFYTTPANRKHLFWTLRAMVRDETIICWDSDFWRECHDFVIPDEVAGGKLKENYPRASRRKHDDCIMAMSIATFANDPAISGPIIVQDKTLRPKMTYLQSLLASDIEKEKKECGKSTTPRGEWDDNVGYF